MSFAVHNLAKFLLIPGKIHFECLLHLLGYIKDNQNLGLKYYDDMNDAPESDMLIEAIINIENQLMAFSISSW